MPPGYISDQVINSHELCTSLAGPSCTTEERLKRVQPHLHLPDQPPSPPTKGTFEFPSLLGCLSDLPKDETMPPQDFTLHEDSDDGDRGFFKAEDLTSSNVLTQLSQDSARRHRRPESKTYEIEETASEHTLQRSVSLDLDFYSIDNVLEEARLFYGDEKPDFCVTTPDHTTRHIKLIDDGVIAKIHFRPWADRLGYWCYTDDTNSPYIVKCIDGNYHTWENAEQGFSKRPIAKVMKAARKESKAKLRTRNREVESTPNRGLRERTARQCMPYTMYNVQKKYDAKGLRLSEADLEDVVNETVSGTPDSERQKKRKVSERRKKRVVSTLSSTPVEDSSPPSTRLPSMSQTAVVSDEDVLPNTVFRTRFSGFDRATIPLVASNAPTHEALFATIRKKWAFKLEGLQLKYCVATFSWLGEDRNILLQEDDPEGFSCMMEEVKCAPGWRREEKVEVVIEIFTE